MLDDQVLYVDCSRHIDFNKDCFIKIGKNLNNKLGKNRLELWLHGESITFCDVAWSVGQK